MTSIGANVHFDKVNNPIVGECFDTLQFLPGLLKGTDCSLIKDLV